MPKVIMLNRSKNLYTVRVGKEEVDFTDKQEFFMWLQRAFFLACCLEIDRAHFDHRRLRRRAGRRLDGVTHDAFPEVRHG